MENPEQNTVVLQSFRQIQSVKLTTGISSEPQQEQQDESEPKPVSNQESAEPTNSSPLQALIEFRMKQLHNRRFLLMKMQHLRKMSGDNGGDTSAGTAKEINCDESDEACELVVIQKELDELLHKKEELERRRKCSNLPENEVNSLRQTSAVTRCPSCDEVVFTETQSKVGDAVWLLCCLCSMAGCVAGCCLIPFFMDRLKSVHHQCPQCQAHIHTFQPF